MIIDWFIALPKWAENHEGYLWLFMVFFVTAWVTPGLFYLMLILSGFAIVIFKSVDFAAGTRAKWGNYEDR